jgi:hypothetical protein
VRRNTKTNCCSSLKIAVEFSLPLQLLSREVPARIPTISLFTVFRDILQSLQGNDRIITLIYGMFASF